MSVIVRHIDIEKMQRTSARKTLNVTALALGTIGLVAAALALALDKTLPYRIGPDHYTQYQWVWRLVAVSLAVALPALILGLALRHKLAVVLALLSPVFLAFIGGVHSGPNPQAWCYNNLRHIEGAKEQLALKNNLTNGVVVTTEQLLPFINGKFWGLNCAEHGTYTINSIRMEARCSVHGTISEMEAEWKVRMGAQRSQGRTR